MYTHFTTGYWVHDNLPAHEHAALLYLTVPRCTVSTPESTECRCFQRSSAVEGFSAPFTSPLRTYMCSYISVMYKLSSSAIPDNFQWWQYPCSTSSPSCSSSHHHLRRVRFTVEYNRIPKPPDAERKAKWYFAAQYTLFTFLWEIFPLDVETRSTCGVHFLFAGLR